MFHYDTKLPTFLLIRTVRIVKGILWTQLLGATEQDCKAAVERLLNQWQESAKGRLWLSVNKDVVVAREVEPHPAGETAPTSPDVLAELLGCQTALAYAELESGKYLVTHAVRQAALPLINRLRGLTNRLHREAAGARERMI